MDSVCALISGSRAPEPVHQPAQHLRGQLAHRQQEVWHRSRRRVREKSDRSLVTF